MQFSDSSRAMNTDVDVFIEAETRPSLAFIEARVLFGQQEERFSRFRSGSLIGRLNAGETVADAWLDRALELALASFDETGGLFNPMVLPALKRAGYDRTFEEVDGCGMPAPGVVPSPHDALRRDDSGWRVLDGAIDLGGIVKGWTSDLAALHLGETYPDVFVNAGGDIRCTGAEAGAAGWLVEVDAPAGGAIWSGAISGAIATSTTAKRRWTTAGGALAHHLIDPRSGLPAEGPFVQATVRAAECWRAEVWAKAVIAGGMEGFERAKAAGVAVLATGDYAVIASAGDWGQGR